MLGKHLGHGSSDDGEKPRWTEVDIYREKDTGKFFVHVIGISTQSGETNRYRLDETMSAFEIIELLTAHVGGRSYIPRQSARALAQAAQWDKEVREAYVNRAVT